MIVENNTVSAERYSPLVYEKELDLKPGTISYDDFWDEQDDRCLNGYKPTNMDRITGEHYFYLNMCQINLLHEGEDRKRAGYPVFRSLDRRLGMETEMAKKSGYGLIIGKPRRVGLSWFGTKEVIYEMTFYLENEVGICAGKQDKADDFYKKVKYMSNRIRPEYRMGQLSNNSEEFSYGYKYRKNKQDVYEGAQSALYIKTMFADSSGFEGKSMSMVIFEEAGLFENLIQSYKATQPCFREGSNQFGSPIIYGTGGEIEKGSKGYKEMYFSSSKHNPQESPYNLKRLFIPAYEYYPGDGDPDEKTGRVISFFNRNTGETREEAALAHILKDRKRAQKSKEGYIKHIQSYPIKESEIFIKSKGGLLDRTKLNAQLANLNEGNCPFEMKTGRLEWVDDAITKKLVSKCKTNKEKAKIRFSRKSKVKWVDDANGLVKRIADPINKNGMEYKPDIAACDSYDEEAEERTSSAGATVVYRCYSSFDTKFDIPICVYTERGDASDDDEFYENNLKMAVYWNYKLLIEYSKIGLDKHFKSVGAQAYLKERPELRDHGPKNSRARNEYGQRMDKYHKELLTKLLKSDVKNNYYNYWFQELILDLIDYGEKNTDLAMAFGLCLIYKLEMFDDITEGIEETDEYVDELQKMTYYDTDGFGNLEIKIYGEDEDEFGIEDFNPQRDLRGEQLQEYNQHVQDQENQIKKQHQEMVEKINKDPFLSALEESIEKDIIRSFNSE